MADHTLLDEVWLLVSPHDPMKEKNSLLNENERLDLVNIALDNHQKIKASDIEFKLPKPSYTIDTLRYLAEKFPQNEFCLIMGSDNLGSFDKWKNYEEILKHYKILVYPRPDKKGSQFDEHPAVTFVDAPLMDISATFIRRSIKEKKDVRSLLHPKVWEYIDTKNFYKN